MGLIQDIPLDKVVAKERLQGAGLAVAPAARETRIQLNSFILCYISVLYKATRWVKAGGTLSMQEARDGRLGRIGLAKGKSYPNAT